ncbi:hypothetical protein ACIBIZ_12650 [Nonomuraea spiralis]|uniref:hypothetical protein n=1 Tax=Nonomuraea spiralis TaxID=46182 RepID=UPI00378E3073
MTFYLDTTIDNFEDFYGKVVDPEWLERSNEPNALALLRARQSDRKPPCRRILHRVMAAQKIASSYALIRRLEPYPGGAVLGAAELPVKVQAVVNARFPTFTPYVSDIVALPTGYHPAAAPVPAPSWWRAAATGWWTCRTPPRTATGR